ncbi:hypothetical protein NKI38_22775 [Mesorhizobium sp. M0621]|uniref:hypothetical protein n=1 Tax=Mesorhizobium sp. M0621 TaxID=2956974 RepID=UPI003336216B
MAAIDDILLEEPGNNKKYAANSNKKKGVMLKYEERIEFSSEPEKPRTSIKDKLVPAASSVELGPLTFYDKRGELDVKHYYNKISAEYV